MNRHRSAGLVLADVASLCLLWPDWADLGRGLRSPHAWIDSLGADKALAQLAGAGLWLVAAWFGLSLAVTLGSIAPGRIGSVLARISEITVPASVRRGIVGTAAVASVLTPLPAFAAPGTQPLQGPALPGSVATAPVAQAHATNTPAPGWPIDRTTASHTDARARATPSTHNAPASVTVAAGDSLWTLAARSLGPHAQPHDIAAAWPRWHQTNHAVIGDNPDLIVPGQHLTIPTLEESP